MTKIGVQSEIDRNWRSWRTSRESSLCCLPAPGVVRLGRTDRRNPQNPEANPISSVVSRCAYGVLQADLPAGLLPVALAFGCTILLLSSSRSSWMLSQFPAFDLCLWLFSIALECVLAAMACLPDARHRFPWFSSYV